MGGDDGSRKEKELSLGVRGTAAAGGRNDGYGWRARWIARCGQMQSRTAAHRP